MQRYFIKLSYNGNNYHGWQVQENTPKTVQHTINEMLSIVLNQPISATGCGRTDAGVHAKEFYAHFDAEKTNLMDEKEKWLFKFNSILPKDIAIQNVFLKDEHANSRFDAVSRTYEYFIHTQKDPFQTDLSCYLQGKYDIQKMNIAAKYLFDYTDFSAFSKSNTQTFTNDCTVMEAYWEQQDHHLIFTIKANRFLRNMVRAIVGTLIEIGKGKLSIEDLKKIIESKNRSNAGVSMPACGLYLVSVEYPENYFNTI